MNFLKSAVMTVGSVLFIAAMLVVSSVMHALRGLMNLLPLALVVLILYMVLSVGLDVDFSVVQEFLKNALQSLANLL